MRRLRYSLTFSICLLLTCLATVSVADDKQQQLQKLDSEMQQLQTLLKQFKSQRSSLENALSQSEINIGKLQQQIRNTQRALNKEQQQLQALTQQKTQLLKNRRAQQHIIEQQIRSAFQIGQQKKLKLLLNQENPETLSRALKYHDYFNEARSKALNDYQETLNTIAKIEPAIQAKTQQLIKSRNQLKQALGALKTNQLSRQQNLKAINHQISDKNSYLKKLLKDRKQLEQLIEKVELAINSIQLPKNYLPFAQLKGKLPAPLTGKPSNSFGSPRAGSQLRWQGITIPANEGKAIAAIHHGRIVFADWLRGSGLLIIIDHGDGYMSLYAHNQSLLGETGDWVQAGETIATAGNSGGQGKSGLYFEIRHNGQPQNPKKWLKRG